MSTRLPRDLLRRSAREGSRLLALSYLDQVELAERSLSDPLDQEALHDFRVGLRRLRSCLRAYREELKGSVSKKVRRSLRELTLATNPGRDAEVQLAWLRAQGPGLESGETAGLGWLIGRLEGRKSETLDHATGGAGRKLLKLTERLRPRLLTFEVEVRVGGHCELPSFGRITGGIIRQQIAELLEATAEVHQIEDAAAAHRARICAKRLRYLLEPLAARIPRVKGYVKRLKELQRILGELHDMQVMRQEIPESAGIPAVEPALPALRARAAQQARFALQSFLTHWSAPRAARFGRRVDQLGESLVRPESTAAGPTNAPDNADAPVPLEASVPGAPVASLTLTTTPLPLPFQLRPQRRLR